MPQICLKRPVLLLKQVSKGGNRTYTVEGKQDSSRYKELRQGVGKTTKGGVNTDQVSNSECYVALP